MAREVRHFTITCPAGTPKAAPNVQSIAFPPRYVREVYWRVPNGPMGTFGWQLSMGGLQVIPIAGDTWIVANDEHGTWELTGQPDSGAWQVTSYNTGANPHSVYLAFQLDLIERPPAFTRLLEGRELTLSPDHALLGPPVTRRP